MLPDNYENLSESAIASLAFSENILECITTRNYWDIINLYKPLMHLWYIGLLMQAYLVIPIAAMAAKYLCKDARNGVLISTIGLFAISLALYLLPSFSEAWKFYLLPFRLFELAAGGIVALIDIRWSEKTSKVVTVVCTAALLLLLCSYQVIGTARLMLLLCTAFTALAVFCAANISQIKRVKSPVNALAVIGKSSFSIYVWHQVVIAYLMYSVFPHVDFLCALTFVAITITVSTLSYHYIEKPLGMIKNIRKAEMGVLRISAVAAIVIGVCSGVLYLHSGVVRDVPELDIEKCNAHRNMHSEYCDRVYAWDSDFKSSDKTKVLVIGDSFGRDWANVLAEWNTDSSLEIRYLYYTEEGVQAHTDRIQDADIVFYATGGEPTESVKARVAAQKLFFVSNKSYGNSNGIVYAKRGSADYFAQTAEVSSDLLKENAKFAEIYAHRFIDLMAPVLVGAARVRVFTDDHKYISQDCRHLTQAGAKFYAEKIDIAGILALAQ